MQSQRQFKPFVISNHALEDPVELRGILERQGYLFSNVLRR